MPIDYKSIKKLAENYHSEISAFLKQNAEWWEKNQELLPDDL